MRAKAATFFTGFHKKKLVDIQQEMVVRFGNDLCDQEREFQVARKKKIKKSLERFLGTSIDERQVPTIAVATSGGGLRATFSTLGFLRGLEAEGILDLSTYIASLSGSSWLVGTWFSLGMSLSELYTYLIQQPWSGLRPTLEQSKYVAQILRTKQRAGQPITLVDIYGALLANRFFAVRGQNCNKIYLSGQASRLIDGSMPLPIYTAISADTDQTWYEFTPFEIGSLLYGLYVPSWSYGRMFNQGICPLRSNGIYCPPEPSLGFHFGTFGAAFASTVEDVSLRLTEEIDNLFFNKTMQMILPLVLPHFGAKRVSKARIYNFMHGIKDAVLEKEKYIDLTDAGLDFNIPYPPLSGQRPGRKADIIIIMDTSRTLDGGGQLEKIKEYASRYSLSLPPIDISEITYKKTVTIFKDETNPDAPVIMYLPRVKVHSFEQEADEYQILKDFDLDKALGSFCKTLNFSYTASQIEQVCKLAEYNVRSSGHAIREAIAHVVQNKK